LLLALACTFALGACGLVPLKEPSPLVPHARLRIIVDTDSARVSGSPASGCLGQPIPNKGSGMIISKSGKPAFFENRSLNMLDPNRIGKSRFAEIYIPSGKYFSIAFNYANIMACFLKRRFLPEASKDYEIEFWTESNLCIMSLSVRTDAGEWKRIPSESVETCPGSVF
jgi:hypothetical protein